MRTFMILSTTCIAAAVISFTACENLFHDSINKYDADTIYMFATSNVFYGNLGGRSGADSLCRSAYDASYTHLGAKNVRAFVSFSSMDQMRDMPEHYDVPDDAKIVGPTNISIADDWEDLLDGTIRTSMMNAGVINMQYWTGDSGTGMGFFNTNYNCQGWTTTVSGPGEIGVDSGTDATWLAVTTNDCSTMDNPILCIAW